MVRAILATGLAIFSLPGFAQAQAPEEAAKQFDSTIAPLLVRRCLDCHTGAKPKAGLILGTRAGMLKGGKTGAAVTPGKLQDSLLWEHVQSGHMPPKKALPDTEKALVKDWIARGAAWGTDPIDPFRFTSETRAGYDWWSLRSVVRPALPAVTNKAWPGNPIDHFVLARLEAKKLAPQPPADRRTLIRRVTFDLIGLPPTPEEIEAFVKDLRPDAYNQLVERLLASPHYGERWARHWLDVVRFGESHGFEHDELRPNAWPYRDWVIRAFNEDLPYDEFARRQLAGDVLRPPDPGSIAATGFLVAGGFDSVGQQQQSAAMRAVVRQDELEDMVGAVGQTFLGLTVNCARCHDHKFDPVRQEEYYRLAAALAGVRHGQRALPSPVVSKENERKQARLKELAADLASLEKPVRDKILAERKTLSKAKETRGPRPMARWDFTKGAKDEIGNLHVTIHGDAMLGPDGLRLPGKTGYGATPPLAGEIKARTLAVRVQLPDLTQRGGAPFSLQTLDGGIFDAIVFGEREAGHWMAGSNGFGRNRSFQGPLESSKEPVHFAIVYHEDGGITGYRNGQLYGQGYVATSFVKYGADKAQFLFGLRHTPAGGNKHFAGAILKVECYDRALTAEEVAASAGRQDVILEGDLVARLTEKERGKRKQILEEMSRLQALPAAALAQVYACVPMTPEATHLLIRGEPAQQGTLLASGGVAALMGVKADFGLAPDATDADRRRALAAWITDAKNPLFPRVMVNRLWHYHFGAGLVDTPSDFGFNGGRPLHAELLDWLAAEFMDPKDTSAGPKATPWSIKHLHRLIVTSKAYQQQSRFQPGAAKVDAGNRFLWRKSPMRLEAEAARDAILHVAGQLNPALGGPGYQDFKLVIRGATHYYNPIDVDNPVVNRRSIYRTWARSGRSNLLDTLDCPDPSTATPKRSLTTTPLQALTLMNNAFVLRMADHFAARLRREAGADVDRQVTRAYELAYGRSPRPEELTLARRVVNQHNLSVLCRAIFNSNEFLYVD